MNRSQNKRLKEMKADLQKKMSSLSPESFPESKDRSRSKALRRRFSQPIAEEVSSIPTHSFQPIEMNVPSQSVPARKDNSSRVKQLEDSRVAVLRQEALSEEALFKQEADLIREMMALYQECVTTTEEERRKRSEERKRCVTTVVKEVEKKEAPKPLDGSLGSKGTTEEVLNGKKAIPTPNPPGPSFGKGVALGFNTGNTGSVFGAQANSSFGTKTGTQTNSSFGVKPDNTKPSFGTKSEPAKPSFSCSFGFKSENGGLAAQTSDASAGAAPKPPAFSFGGGTGLFGAKKEESVFKSSFGGDATFGQAGNAGGLFGGVKGGDAAPKPPVPSFGNVSSFGAKKETGGLFPAKSSEAPTVPAPSFGGGLFNATNGGLFGSKKDDPSKPAFSFGQSEKSETPSFSPGLSSFFDSKDVSK